MSRVHWEDGARGSVGLDVRMWLYGSIKNRKNISTPKGYTGSYQRHWIQNSWWERRNNPLIFPTVLFLFFVLLVNPSMTSLDPFSTDNESGPTILMCNTLYQSKEYLTHLPYSLSLLSSYWGSKKRTWWSHLRRKLTRPLSKGTSSGSSLFIHQVTPWYNSNPTDDR